MSKCLRIEISLKALITRSIALARIWKKTNKQKKKPYICFSLNLKIPTNLRYLRPLHYRIHLELSLKGTPKGLMTREVRAYSEL